MKEWKKEKLLSEWKKNKEQAEHLEGEECLKCKKMVKNIIAVNDGSDFVCYLCWMNEKGGEMIQKDKLKFKEVDLKFFERQLEDKQELIGGLHESIFEFLKINAKHRYISGKEIAKMFGVEVIKIREIVLQIRRYWKIQKMGENGKYFITAKRDGYTLSKVNCCDDCNENIIDYFNKTQTRWKETFYELNNLMILLNMIK